MFLIDLGNGLEIYFDPTNHEVMESYFSNMFEVRISANVLKEIGTTIPFHISADFG